MSQLVESLKRLLEQKVITDAKIDDLLKRGIITCQEQTYIKGC